MNNQIYREVILEHYHNPHNIENIKHHTHQSRLVNYSCGDEINLKLLIENDKIKEVQHDTRGCAIAIASASILSDHIKNKSLDYIEDIDQDTMLELVAIKVTPSRLKCLLLPLEAVKKALLPED